MANYLLFKGKPTLSVDSVERDLQNYEISKQYSIFYEATATIAGTITTPNTLALPSLTALPSSACFIELISDQDISLTFKLTSGITTTTLSKIKYLAGNFLAYDFVASNAGADDANITWRIYIV